MGVIEEQRLIGCILINSDTLGLCTNIQAEMFLDQTTRLVFECIEKLRKNNKPLSLPEIVNLCDGKLTTDYINNTFSDWCSNVIVPSLEISGYANAIISDYTKKNLKDISQELHKMDITRVNCNDIKRNIINRLNAIPDDANATDPSISTLVENNKGDKFKMRDNKYLYFGMKNLDGYIGGLEGGDLAVIAARTAVGKSAFANQLMVNCCRQGLKVGLFNVELTAQQVYDRLLCHVSGINLTRIRHAACFQSKEEEEAFNKANDELSKFKLNIHCGDSYIEDIKNICIFNRYDIVFIDYIQLISTREKGLKRYEEVGRVSKEAKNIAMMSHIPVVILSQLNRNNDDDKEPSITDLRESGNLEQDASAIMLLWNKDGDRKKKGIKVAKSRQGQPGTGLMEFDGAKMKFIEINTKREQAVMQDDGFVVADPNDNPFFGS